jgi:hypothetical protein
MFLQLFVQDEDLALLRLKAFIASFWLEQLISPPAELKALVQRLIGHVVRATLNRLELLVAKSASLMPLTDGACVGVVAGC